MFGAYLFYDLIADNSEDTGAYGEMIVNSVISLPAFKNKNCKLYKDVYIQNDGFVSQIDHIFIMDIGVLVVETKMFNGVVAGSPSDMYWYATNYGHRIQFYNPIKQNAAHVEAVRKLIGDYNIIPLVVFAWSNKPKREMNGVLNFSEFKDYPLFNQTENPLSSEDIEYICHLLDENNKNKKVLKEKHLKQIKEL